jgi:sphingomyelin phosphodiesterase acid-like 3
MRTAFCFLACLLLVLHAPPIFAAGAQQQWLVVSDIHFNPLADPRLGDRLNSSPVDRWRTIYFSAEPQPFSGYGSDTNFPLLESALEAMRNVVESPRVVMITGDFLGHSFRKHFDAAVRDHDDAHYRAFVDNTIRFLATEFREAFPRSQFVIVLGNNDSYCGDYQIEPGSPFLARVAASWGASVGVQDPSRFVAQFSTGGYYTAPLPAGGAQAIVLNDVFWSAGYQNRCGNTKDDPAAAELSWLQNTARELRGKRVWVLAHIPPGIDAYSSYHAKPQAGVLFLQQRYNDGVIAALDSIAPNIPMMLSGHTHMNGFRILGPDPSNPQVPILVIPALSPVFESNPTFTVLHVNASDAGVADAQYFVLDDLATLSKNGRYPARWRREFDFDSVFGHGVVDAWHLSALQQSIFDNDRVRYRYEEYYDGDSGRAPMTDESWRFFWCADVALTPTTYDACATPQVQHQLPPQPSPPPLPSAVPSPTPAPAPTPGPTPSP